MGEQDEGAVDGTVLMLMGTTEDGVTVVLGLIVGANVGELIGRQVDGTLLMGGIVGEPDGLLMDGKTLGTLVGATV